MKRDEPDDVIANTGARMQYLSISGELALDPSYSVTESNVHVHECSNVRSSNVATTTYSRAFRKCKVGAIGYDVIADFAGLISGLEF